jgi:hypothetical protein
MEPPSQTCLLCSNPLENLNLSIAVCLACSQQVIKTHFSPNRFSALFGVVDLNDDFKSSKNHLRDLILSQNPQKDLSYYEILENRRDENFLEDFFNVSLFQKKLTESNSFLFLTYTHSLLVRFDMDTSSLERAVKLNGLQAETKFSQVYLSSGIIFLCEWKKDVRFDGENLTYLIFDPEYNLQFSGPLKCHSNPHLCPFEEDLFAIFGFSSIQKFSFQSKSWSETFSVYFSAIDISSAVFGSKIILSAQNKSSLDTYSPIEDRIFELIKSECLKDSQKLMFLEGNIIFLVCTDRIVIYDLKTSDISQKFVRNSIFTNFITAPVFYKGKFYLVNFDNSNIGIFSPGELKFVTLSIRDKLANINYIYNFLS